MKKVIFFLFALSLAGKLQAQTFNLGVSGGYTNSSVYGTQTGTIFTNSGGFNAGAFVDYNWKCLTVESGLYFVQKGYNSYSQEAFFYPNGSVNVFSATGKITLNYLEIPLNLLYNFKMPFGKLFIGGGAYFDDPVSGRSHGVATQFTTPGPAITSTFNGNTAIGRQGNEFTSFTGFEATAGMRLNNRLLFAFKLQGAFTNLTNATNQTVKPDSFKSSAYSISAGYLFL